MATTAACCSGGKGYALAKRFADISGDYYRPSPGVLYPALAQLEDWGLVKVQPIGKRKVYHLEQAGLKKLEENAEHVQFLIAALKHAAKKMQWMSQLPGGEAAASKATGWLPEFIQARKAWSFQQTSPDPPCAITRHGVMTPPATPWILILSWAMRGLPPNGRCRQQSARS
ncbi:MAG: helix-turn-helix transcriptional regulator [Comamonas sp.]|nr:helix-turn-helix transcriptional regulator [Comamonas sp.]